MDIHFDNSHNISIEQILLLEKKINFSIPEYLKIFLLKNTNSIPKINGKRCFFKIVHEDGWIQESCLEKIVSINDIIIEFEDRDTLNLYVKDSQLSTDFVEIDFLCPFAIAVDGVIYISIYGKHQGKVYFADNGDFGILFLANSFEKFWEQTYESTF